MIMVRAMGLNVAYHMSVMASQGIVMHNAIRLDSRHIQLVCSRVDRAHVVQYLTDNNFCDIIVSTMGWYGIAEAIRRHAVLCAIVLLLVPVLWINSLYCNSIEISGDIDSDSVLDALADIGVAVGARIDNIDYDIVENHLASVLDLSYAVIEVIGNKLYVSTVDNTDDTPVIDYSQSRDIVASSSGTVTAISVVQGTAVVSVGQYVSVGDVLISGVRTYSDGTTTPIYAIGTVTAEVSVSSTVVYSGYMQQWQYTGNSVTVVAIDIANTTVYGGSCSYSNYDVSTSTTTLYPLAIEVTYYYYTEKISTSVAVTYEEYLDSMQQQALQEAMQSVYFTVDNTIYTTVRDSSVTVTLIGSIVISGDTLASNGG